MLDFCAVFTLALAWWPQLVHRKTDWLGRLSALRCLLAERVMLLVCVSSMQTTWWFHTS